MDRVRATVEMGHSARAQRQDEGSASRCAAAVVVADGAEREAIEVLGDLVREELNVKELRFVADADELGSYEVKANYRTLGPRFGKAMPQVAAAIASLDPAARRRRAARRRDRRHPRRRRRARARPRTTSSS